MTDVAENLNKRILIRMSDDLHQRLQRQAEKDERPAAAVIRLALRKYLDEQEEQP